MKNLKKILATVTFMIALMINISTAKAGILLSDLKSGDSHSCIETKNNWAVIVTGFTGVIVTDFTGVIVTDAMDTQTNCGILLSD